jgi:hypothetical protein
MTVRSEMNALFESAGTELVTVHEVVAWAKEHPESALYRELKCDDDASAAHLWRLHHGRVLIAVYVTDERGARKTISLSTDRSMPGGGYRDIDAVAKDQQLHQIALEDALRELARVQAKYENIKGLEKIWAQVEEVRFRSGQSAQPGLSLAAE